jgi:hypothetical protein
MSWWRKTLGTVGDVAKFALPAAAFIPGVNLGVGALAGLGAAAGAAGSLNDKRADGRYKPLTIGSVVPGAVKGGAGAAAGGYLAGTAGGNPGRALSQILAQGGRGAEWLTNGENAGRAALATGLLSTGAGMLGGRAQGAVEDEERGYSREMDAAREARRAEILKLLMTQLGPRGAA